MRREAYILEMSFALLLRHLRLLGVVALSACAGSEPAADAATALSEAGALDAGLRIDAGLDAAEAEADAATPDALRPVERDAGLADTVLEVTGGTIEGKREGSARLFLGIPFAAPPIGALRFAPPAPVKPWSGVRKTMEYGDSCLQPMESAEGKASEDCLTLNVFTPAEVTAGAPVMVFFYGGAFISGTSRNMDGRFLAEAGELVVVTVNFRLGALGFLTHPALDTELHMTSGNMGFRDQQRALSWVQDNIASFGGDPRRVTLFGQSSGAVSVCLHMVAPDSAGLAQRYVLESGSCYPRTRTRENLLSASNDELGRQCPLAADPLACMRALPESAFVPADRVGAAFGGAWFTHVDGELIPEQPGPLIRAGRYHHGPVLLGSNLHEFGYLARFIPTPTDAITYGVMTAFFWSDNPLLVIDHYLPPNSADIGEAWLRQQSDGMFRCPTRSLARSLSRQGDPVFLYSFDLLPAVHGLELDYVFGWPAGGVSKEFPNDAPLPPLPDLIATTQGYITRFAATGDPNGGAAPAWPTFDTVGDRHLQLGRETKASSGLSKVDCDMWDAYFQE